jgi:glycosyltransferase involved in cell wall biosynthesis
MQSHCDRSTPEISVIVPTTCEQKRADQIQRAIQSIEQQQGARIEILIIVNGDQYDTDLLLKLKNNPSLRIIQLANGNVSAARYQGVLESTAEFFCFLDDDDEFLPGAMAKRVSLFAHESGADIVVTNGYLHKHGDKLLVPAGLSESINTTPATMFLATNWFASPSCSFRRKSIEQSLFDLRYKFFEWTYLFFLLLSKGKRFHFDESLTYRIHQDNPLSVSKTIEYFDAYPDFLLKLKLLPLEPSIQKALAKKYVIALNSLSNLHLKQRDVKNAWAFHIKCLMSGGFGYLPYTRHLVLPWLRVWP